MHPLVQHKFATKNICERVRRPAGHIKEPRPSVVGYWLALKPHANPSRPRFTFPPVRSKTVFPWVTRLVSLRTGLHHRTYNINFANGGFTCPAKVHSKHLLCSIENRLCHRVRRRTRGRHRPPGELVEFVGRDVARPETHLSYLTRWLLARSSQE